MPKLSLKPQNISPLTWFYDDPKGLLVVHECRKKGALVQTDQFIIPWRKVRAALKRKDTK